MRNSQRIVLVCGCFLALAVCLYPPFVFPISERTDRFLGWNFIWQGPPDDSHESPNPSRKASPVTKLYSVLQTKVDRQNRAIDEVLDRIPEANRVLTFDPRFKEHVLKVMIFGWDAASEEEEYRLRKAIDRGILPGDFASMEFQTDFPTTERTLGVEKKRVNLIFGIYYGLLLIELLAVAALTAGIFLMFKKKT